MTLIPFGLSSADSQNRIGAHRVRSRIRCLAALGRVFWAAALSVLVFDLQTSPRSIGRSLSPFSIQRVPRILSKKAGSDRFYTSLPLGSRSCRRVSSSDDHPAEDVDVMTFLIGEAKIRHPGAKNFVRSLEASGYNKISFVGSGSFEYSNSFWLSRSTSLLKALELKPPSQLVIITDALDVLFVHSQQELMKRSRNLGDDVVFGAEALCDMSLCRENSTYRHAVASRAPPHAQRVYLNAGFVLGKAQSLVEVYREALEVMRAENCDDQAAFTRVWLDSAGAGKRIKLDYDSEFIGVISAAEEHFPLHWTGGRDANSKLFRSRLRDVKSGSTPVAVHFPGIGYQGSKSQLFNRCQQHLSRVYNDLVRDLKDFAEREVSKYRVVVTLTTTPLRIPFLRETLNSLNDQTLRPSAIYLNVPYFSKRFNVSYEVPEELKTMENLYIRRSDDYGPGTKILPTILDENDPDTLIITVDDEYKYPRYLVEDLVAAQVSNPNAAFGYAGQIIEQEDLSPVGLVVLSVDDGDFKRSVAGVDIIEGFLGAIYRRSFFDIEKLIPPSSPCISTDDIWISGYLASQGIPRIKLPYTRFKRPEELPHDKLAPSRENNVHGAKKNEICAFSLISNFKRGWLESPEMCPHDYSTLDASHALGERFDEEWTADSVLSPCNPMNFEEGRGIAA